MSSHIAGKVAIITGAGAGIGLCYAKELLRNGLKAVTLADTNTKSGEKAMQEIKKEFGPNRSMFVKTDVSNKEQFENAFESTLANFNNIDILINNAGIMDDSIWETQININLIGTIHGCLLALDKYLPKYRNGPQGVVVNISSIAGLEKFQALPIYAATKLAVIGLTRSWGTDDHFYRTKVRFLTLCPGVTDTPLVHDCLEKNLGPAYQAILKEHLPQITMQPPEFVAKALVDVIKKGENGSVWVAECSQPPYEINIPSRHDIIKKD